MTQANRGARRRWKPGAPSRDRGQATATEAPSSRTVPGTVAERLRSLLQGSPPGTRLPTVRQAMAEFGVSQHAVQNALDQLRREGLITTHVGKGTFVGNGAILRPKTRSVLTLLHERIYQRGDAVARGIHQRLLAAGHNSIVVTYGDEKHLMEQLRAGAHFDTCIIQPRSSMLSVSLLSFARARADNVILESFAAEGIDVDAVSNDPLACVRLIMNRLTGLGHRRIAWITEAGTNYFFQRSAQLFRAYCEGAGLSEQAAPLVFGEVDPARLGMRDLRSAITGVVENPSTRCSAIVVSSFAEGAAVVEGFHSLGLRIPQDVSVVRIGTPDLEADHLNAISIVGRPSAQAAQTVVDRIAWRWGNPSTPAETILDAPQYVEFGSTAKPGTS